MSPPLKSMLIWSIPRSERRLIRFRWNNVIEQVIPDKFIGYDLFFWWEKVQKWLWNRGDIMIISRSIQSSTNRHKSGLGTRFHRLYYPIIILDKDCLWTEYWGCWKDLIAMHHFGRTDGLFAGNKSFEIVQLLCVVSVSVIVTNNRPMWQRSLFFKIT